MSSELQALLLLAAAAVSGILLLLNGLIKTLARREKIGFIDIFLVFLTVALLILALVFDFQTSDSGQPLVMTGTLGIAAVLGGFSLLILLLELFRPQRLRDSRGLLGLWGALLVALSTQTVPLIARNLSPVEQTPNVAAIPTLTAEATEDARTGASAVTVIPPPATATPEPTATATATTTQTPTVRPSATATATREAFVYSSPMPLPSPTLPTPCVGTLPYNVRLRAEPDAEAETLGTIPFDTTIAIYGKDGATPAWWYTEYEDTYGWVDAEFVQTVGCAAVPVRNTN